MEDFKNLIKQEDYNKYNELLHKFECKAMDLLEDLTYQFKETLAEEIDDKIKGWKKDNEELSRENFVQKERIAELEQDLEFTTKTANDLIEIKHKLEQELAIKDKMINLIWIDLFHLNNDNNDWTKSLDKYKQEAQAKLKEIQGNE